MNFIDDYITTEYNIFLAELKSEKKKQGQSALGTVGGVEQMVTTTLDTPPEELPSRTPRPSPQKTATPRSPTSREGY